MTRDEKLRNYSDRVLLYLLEHQVKDGLEVKYYDIARDLGIPQDFHKTVFDFIYHANPKFIDGRQGFNPVVWLTEHGKEFAMNLLVHEKLKQKNHLINVYKVKALRTIKNLGIGTEHSWNKVSETAQISSEFSDDIKNILHHEGFIRITRSANGIGDFVAGQSLISGYLLGLHDLPSNPPLSVTQNFNAGRDINQSGNIQSSLTDLDNDSSSSNTTNTPNANSQKSFWQKILHWTISHIWQIISALLIAYLAYRLGWN